MDQQRIPSQRSTWLSLVAETAGVSGASVARVPVRCPRFRGDAATVFVQVLNREGNVIGAARQTVRGTDLREGLSIDLGVELDLARSGWVTAWVDEHPAPMDAWVAAAPGGATRAPFDPFFPSVLLLNRPAHSDLAA